MNKKFRILLMALSLTALAAPALALSPLPPAKSAAEAKPLSVGDSIPNVNLTNADGLDVPLMRLVKNQPSVIIFYRGGWCVYCNTQLGQLKQIETDLQKLGYQIIAISPDKVDKIRESLKKHNLTYMLLSDSQAVAIQAFGLAFQVDDETYKKYKKDYGLDLEEHSGAKHHLLPVPAAFVVDQKGKIHWVYSNPDYKVRVDAQALLQAAAAAVPAQRKQ